MKWQGKAVPVTKHSLEAAIEWLWELDPMSTVCRTAPTEALLEALFDETVIVCIFPEVFNIVSKASSGN